MLNLVPTGEAAQTAKGDDLLRRLAELVPALRERAEAAERAGRIPDETVRDLLASDVFRAVVPARFGGLELPFRYIPQIFRILARGCVSTAWTMGFLVYHNFQFGHFGEAAQQEVWGQGRGFTMAPGQVMPAGRAEKVDGGYRLSGRWGYATGILHGDWMLLSAPVVNGEDASDIRRFYVPVEAFRILDTWDVAAMRATGSRDVELDDVFVPEHRQMRVADLRAGRGPGLALNRGPLWQVPLLAFMSLGAVGPFIGAAEAMHEIVVDELRNKVRAYSGQRAQQQMTTRVRLSQVTVRLQAVVALWERQIADIEEIIAQGGRPDEARRAQVRAAVAHIAAEAHAIVGALALEAGSRGNYASSPVQRFLRDINALATHSLFERDQNGDLFGQALLGMPLPETAMI